MAIKTEVYLFACPTCSTVKAHPEEYPLEGACHSIMCGGLTRKFNRVQVSTDSDFDNPIHFYSWIG